jgi:hypothetical protein
MITNKVVIVILFCLNLNTYLVIERSFWINPLCKHSEIKADVITDNNDIIMVGCHTNFCKSISRWTCSGLFFHW